MSMLVAHMKKHNTGSSCSGMYSHNERLGESKTNKDIDENKKHLNYELVNLNHNSYNQIIKNKIKELGYGENGKKQLRKDAVKMCSWIISSDNDFFKKLDEFEEKRFFQESLNFFKNEFGENNIISATVHKDEATPHMHLNIMPILNNKFNCKTLFNKSKLRKIQEELPKYLQSKGFNILRGKENSQNKHLNEIEFKIKKKQEQLNQLDELTKNKKILSKEIANLILELDIENINSKELIKNYNKTISKINDIDNNIKLILKNLITQEKKELKNNLNNIENEIKVTEKNKVSIKNKINEKKEILKKLNNKNLTIDDSEVKKGNLELQR